MGNLKNLQKLRKAKGLSREDMANRLQVGFYSYEAYEQERRDPTISTLKKISKILECKIDDLI